MFNVPKGKVNLLVKQKYFINYLKETKQNNDYEL